MEIWDLYDENKKLLNQTLVRGEDIPENCYHLVVHVWIKNRAGKFLMTRRAENRPTYPLMYECVTGSVLSGEKGRDGALREVFEEVGLDFKNKKGKIIHSAVRKKVEGKKYNDILESWLFEYNGEVDLSKASTDEVCEIRWCSIFEIKELLEQNKLVPSLEYIFDVFEKTQNNQKNNDKNKKNNKKSQYNREKSKYFDFYDDIKHSSHKVIDW